MVLAAANHQLGNCASGAWSLPLLGVPCCSWGRSQQPCTCQGKGAPRFPAACCDRSQCLLLLQLVFQPAAIHASPPPACTSMLTPAWQVFRCWSSGVLHTYVHRSGVAWYPRVVGCDVCKQLLLYADRLCSPSMPAQHSTKMMQLSQIWLDHRQSSTHSYIAHTAIGWHRLVSSSVSYRVTAHTGQKTRAVRRP